MTTVRTLAGPRALRGVGVRTDAHGDDRPWHVAAPRGPGQADGDRRSRRERLVPRGMANRTVGAWGSGGAAGRVQVDGAGDEGMTS